MKETLEKIKNGTIRIENGKLKGLGMMGDESIDIEALNDVISYTGTSGCIKVLCRSISSVADILSANFERKDDEIKEYVNEDIIPSLPTHREVFVMEKLIDVFNTYR